MTADEQSLLDDLLAIESGLTGWEMDFIENLDRAWRERVLTPAQEDKMNQTAKKVGLLK